MKSVATGDTLGLDVAGIRLTFTIVLEPTPHVTFIEARTIDENILVELPTGGPEQMEALGTAQLLSILEWN